MHSTDRHLWGDVNDVFDRSSPQPQCSASVYRSYCDRHPSLLHLQSNADPTKNVDIKQHVNRGIVLVGNPIGSVAFCKSIYNDKAAKTGQVVDRLIALANYNASVAIQSTMLNLRFCTEPKIAHLLRSAPPDIIRDAAVTHDGTQQGKFAR